MFNKEAFSQRVCKEMATMYKHAMYFRPWGAPLVPETTPQTRDPDKMAVKAEAEVLDLSKKDARTCLDLSIVKCEENSKETRVSGEFVDGVHWNQANLQHNLLFQQLQAYYHFMNSLPIIQQQQVLQQQALLKELQLKHQKTNSQILDSKSPVEFVKSCSPQTLTFPHPPRRNILNIPSPNFNHKKSISVENELMEPERSGHYPLPSANDGEPLDLLPKSLYMNKSHGGHLCIFCGKLYSRKYGLKIHLRTHTGYKPLKCKVCHRPFGDPSNLNKHIRLHAEGETPYRCEYCGKVLVRRRDLERHIRSRHPDSISSFTPLDCSSSKSEEDFEEFDSDIEVNEELDVVG